MLHVRDVLLRLQCLPKASFALGWAAAAIRPQRSPASGRLLSENVFQDTMRFNCKKARMCRRHSHAIHQDQAGDRSQEREIPRRHLPLTLLGCADEVIEWRGVAVG